MSPKDRTRRLSKPNRPVEPPPDESSSVVITPIGARPVTPGAGGGGGGKWVIPPPELEPPPTEEELALLPARSRPVAKIVVASVVVAGVLAGAAYGAFLLYPKLFGPPNDAVKPIDDPSGAFTVYVPVRWSAEAAKGEATAMDPTERATLRIVAQVKEAKSLDEAAKAMVGVFKKGRPSWTLLGEEPRKVSERDAIRIRCEWKGGRSMRYEDHILAQTDRHDITLTLGCAKRDAPRFESCFEKIIASLQLHTAARPPAPQAPAVEEPGKPPAAEGKAPGQAEAKPATKP